MIKQSYLLPQKISPRKRSLSARSKFVSLHSRFCVVWLLILDSLFESCKSIGSLPLNRFSSRNAPPLTMLRRSVAWRDKNECEGDNSIGIQLTNPIIFALRPHFKTSLTYNQLSNGHIYKSDSYGWSLPDTSIQWNLDTATNLYITKSSVSGTIFFVLVIVWKCTKENFDEKKPRYCGQILPVAEPSSYRVSTACEDQTAKQVSKGVGEGALFFFLLPPLPPLFGPATRAKWTLSTGVTEIWASPFAKP